MSETVEGHTRVSPKRLVSLDVLRGITVAFMILVNNGGNGAHTYWALKHVEWNGWSPTDMVFPTFVFLMGTAIVFSTEARLERGDSKGLLLVHSVRRAVILFLLGLVVNGFPYFHLGTLRIYGVLQRIAVCFLVGSALYLCDRRVWTKVVMAVVLLVGYWALLRFVPVPGYGMPGRDVPFLDKAGNLTSYIDRLVFPGRLYVGIRDPEGLLSDLPAIATMLLGMLTGLWLRTGLGSGWSIRVKAGMMLLCGLICVASGLVWNLWFPINKNMWTSSFVLLAAGWTLLAFGICSLAVDVQGKKRAWMAIPLMFGMNTITAYVFSELLASLLYSIRIGSRSLQEVMYQSVFGAIQPQEIGSLLYSIAFVGACLIPVYVLYRKRIFVRI